MILLALVIMVLAYIIFVMELALKWAFYAAMMGVIIWLFVEVIKKKKEDK